MTQWIVIPGWDRFQHYGDRDPPWIKTYLRLLDKDEYLALTAVQRALLHNLWMLYAKWDGLVPFSPEIVNRRIGLRTKMRTFEALNRAGFIEVVASKPLARRYHQRQSKRTPPSPPEGGNNSQAPARSLSRRELRRYTGCRHVRGTHSTGYQADVLGTDPPPRDWPHDRPTEGEVLAALEHEAHNDPDRLEEPHA